jgi:hypothetical protein
MTLMVPKTLEHLMSVKKIKYKNEHIKTVHLFHLVHRFIYKWTFDIKDVPLYSPTLQKTYGMKYHLLLEYLIENGIIEQIGNYSTEKGTSNRYKLLIPLDEVKIYQSTDYVFNKNYRLHLEEKKKSICDEKSPIPILIRKKLLSDLQSVTINNYNGAIELLDETLQDNRRKYLKNLIMLTKLKDDDIFWRFDIVVNKNRHRVVNLVGISTMTSQSHIKKKSIILSAETG